MIKATCLLILSALLIAPAHSCDCVNKGTPEEHIESSAFVAVGVNLSARVMGRSEIRNLFPVDGVYWTPSNIAVARFKVTIPIKNIKKGEIVPVYYDSDGTDCSMAPSVGVERVLFVDELSGHYFAYSCSNEWYFPAETRRVYLNLFEELSGHDFPGIN